MEPVVLVQSRGPRSPLLQHIHREAAGLWENAVSYRLAWLLFSASALILLVLSSSVPPAQRRPSGLQMESLLSTAAALGNPVHPSRDRREDLALDPVLALAMAAQRTPRPSGTATVTGRPSTEALVNGTGSKAADHGEGKGSVILQKVVEEGSGKHKTVISVSQSRDDSAPGMSEGLHSPGATSGASDQESTSGGAADQEARGKTATHGEEGSQLQQQQQQQQEQEKKAQQLSKGAGEGEKEGEQGDRPQGRDKEKEKKELAKVEQRIEEQRKLRAQRKQRREGRQSWKRRSSSSQAASQAASHALQAELEEMIIDQGVGSWNFSDDAALAQKRKPIHPQCDLWSGRWVYDESYPLWEVGSCNFGLNNSGCTQLGRKDTHYMHFRWQPDQCDLPRFNASEVRERLWGKRIIVIGDSLARNHFQSMICLVASGIPNAHEVVQEISGAANRSRLDWRVYRFQGFNFTMEYYVSHFLVQQRSKPKHMEFPKEVSTILNADVMDFNSVHRMEKATEDLGLQGLHRILVLNAGHWFNRVKTYDQGSYFMRDGKVDTSLPLVDGFESSMRTVAKWMQEQRQLDNATVLWRSYSPVHFTDGAWNKGGHCRNQWPLPGNVSANSTHQAEDYVDETDAMAEAAMRVMKESKIPIIDILPLSSVRPDGHPSRYFNSANRGQDCSHWCLPGVPDAWSELMFAYLKVNRLF